MGTVDQERRAFYKAKILESKNFLLSLLMEKLF